MRKAKPPFLPMPSRPLVILLTFLPLSTLVVRISVVLLSNSFKSSIFSINCFIYTVTNLNFIFRSHHSLYLWRHFYVLLVIRLLIRFELQWTLESLLVNYNIRICLYVDALFLVGTADKVEVKIPLARNGKTLDWGTCKSLTHRPLFPSEQMRTYNFSLGRLYMKLYIIYVWF